MSEVTTQLPPARSVFVEDAARLLGVSRRTVYYRIREGRLQTIRTRCGSRRVLIESIDALLREDVPAASGAPAGASGAAGRAQDGEPAAAESDVG